MYQSYLMQKAFIVAIAIGIMLPLVGRTIIFKKLSLVGDTLAHTSLAGIAVGLIAGVDPVIGSVISCFVAALSIEYIRKHFSKYADISLVLVLSLGLAIAVTLAKFSKTYTSFESYLFGSIIIITKNNLIAICTMSLLVTLFCVFLYKELFLISFDETSARLSGVKVGIINFLFTLVIAGTVAISVQVIGALLLSAMLIIPVANALLISKSYFKITVLSVLFGLFDMIVGVLLIPVFPKFVPSTIIVLVGIISIVITVIVKFIIKNLKRRQA